MAFRSVPFIFLALFAGIAAAAVVPQIKAGNQKSVQHVAKNAVQATDFLINAVKITKKTALRGVLEEDRDGEDGDIEDEGHHNHHKIDDSGDEDDDDNDDDDDDITSSLRYKNDEDEDEDDDDDDDDDDITSSVRDNDDDDDDDDDDDEDDDRRDN